MSDYYCLTFKITPYSEDAADLLAAFVADIGFESFEQEKDVLKGYVQKDNYDEPQLVKTVSSFPIEATVEWEKALIPHQDWNEEWEKKYFQPLVLGDGLCVVHSTFHTEYPPAQYEIIVDPKMAFGTGHHATTAMMVNHLIENDVAGKRVVDMGTGTGILGILAYKRGAAEVTGIEIDCDACENARENAKLNDAAINLIHGDASLLEGMKDIDIFLANINRNIILADLDRYVATLKQGGKLFLSGFYSADVALLDAALKQNGMKIANICEQPGSWASICAVKE